MLRRALDKNGFSNVRIVAADVFQEDLELGLARDVLIDRELSEAIDYFGYTNIHQKLQNKSYGPMHYKIGVTCVFNDTRYEYIYDKLMSVWSMFPCVWLTGNPAIKIQKRNCVSPPLEVVKCTPQHFTLNFLNVLNAQLYSCTIQYNKSINSN